MKAGQRNTFYILFNIFVTFCLVFFSYQQASFMRASKKCFFFLKKVSLFERTKNYSHFFYSTGTNDRNCFYLSFGIHCLKLLNLCACTWWYEFICTYINYERRMTDWTFIMCIFGQKNPSSPFFSVISFIFSHNFLWIILADEILSVFNLWIVNRRKFLVKRLTFPWN